MKPAHRSAPSFASSGFQLASTAPHCCGAGGSDVRVAATSRYIRLSSFFSATSSRSSAAVGKSLSVCTNDVRPSAGCNIRVEIGSIGRCSRFLKDDVEPRVASKRDDHVLGIPHRHQLLFTRESDVRCDPFPQQNTLIDRTRQPTVATATNQVRRHRSYASHRPNQGALYSITSVHGSFQRTVVETDPAAFNTLSTAIGHFQCRKAKANLAILTGLRQLADSLRARRNDESRRPVRSCIRSPQ